MISTVLLSHTGELLAAATILLGGTLFYAICIQKKHLFFPAREKKDVSFEHAALQATADLRQESLAYIRRELQEEVGQKLAVARLLSNKLISSGATAESENAQKINWLLGECIQEIRNLSRGMLEKKSESYYFLERIEAEIYRLTHRSPLNIDLRIGSVINLDRDSSVLLFRLVQVCLQKFAAHSNSQNILLEVDEEWDMIQITMRDSDSRLKDFLDSDAAETLELKNQAKIIYTELSFCKFQTEGVELSLRYNSQHHGKN